MGAGPARPGASADSIGRRPVEAKTVAEAKAAVEESVRTASHARDTTLGLGPEGPVVTALSDAARNSLAPERGSAIFLAIVDANGLVTELRLLSSRGGDEGWRDAHKRASQALTGKKLALRGAKGAHLQIEINSDMKLPSGGSAPISVTPSGPGSPQAPGGRFDVADIGSSAHRVVHARLLSATML